MDMEYQMVLPEPEEFYTGVRDFTVQVVEFCGRQSLPNKQTVNIPSSPELSALLAQHDGKQHQASLEAITEAAMRFYQPQPAQPELAGTVYTTRLHALRHEVSHFLAQTKYSNSLGRRTGKAMRLHGEATRGCTELTAYGLALTFVSHLLKISYDRFSFITGGGARPDFSAELTREEIVRLGFQSLMANGKTVHVEVKGATKASFPTGDKQANLLANIHKKADNSTASCFLAIYIAWRSSKPRRSSDRSTVYVIDPGDGPELLEKAQIGFLLREVVFQSYRFGLWKTLSDGLTWMRMLELDVSPADQRKFKGVLKRVDTRIQKFLITRSYDDRKYCGRSFSPDLLRWFHQDMTADEAREILKDEQVRPPVFQGVDIGLADIVARRDAPALLQYGIGTQFAGTSGFISREEPLSSDDVREVLNVLRRDLDR